MCLAMRSAVAGRNSSVAYSMPPVSSSPSSMLSTRSVCACALPSCRAPMRIRLPSARVCAHMALAQRARWHGHCVSTAQRHVAPDEERACGLTRTAQPSTCRSAKLIAASSVPLKAPCKVIIVWKTGV